MDKIIVLDGHTLNPDDISWEPLQGLGELTVYPRTDPDQIVERAKDADFLLFNKIKMRRDIIEQLTGVKYMGLMATGFDNVDIEAATEQGITVTNVPEYGTPSVAQHTFALILQLANRVEIHNKSVHDMEWVRSADFSYYKAPLVELEGKVMGLVGYGRISKMVERIASAFGMEVLISSEHAEKAKYGTIVSFDQVVTDSDVLSLHCALDERTRGIINSEVLGRMKKSAWIINTSRGAVINEADLTRALEEGEVAAAALDVLSTEPPAKENPLLYAPNCVITPHISWASRESRIRLMEMLAENIRCFRQKEPINVIS